VRQIVIATVAAAVLVCVPAAAAKEITSVRVCGTDGCTTTKDRALLAALTDNGTPTDPPSHPSGAIRLRARMTEPGGDVIGHFDSWWVPGTPLLASADGSWLDLGPRARAVLERVAGDRVPFAPGRIGAAFAAPARTAAPQPAPSADGGDSDPAGWFVIGGLSIALALGVAYTRRRPRGATG
jgi:hypothetical protein